MGDDGQGLRTAVEVGTHDIILLDCLEERLPGPSGSGQAPVALGQPGHLELWRRGWMTFMDQLRASGKLDRLFVHEAYFALMDDHGTAHPKEAWLQTQNDWLAALHGIIRESLPPERIITVDPRHRCFRADRQGDPITCVGSFPRAFEKELLAALAASRPELVPAGVTVEPVPVLQIPPPRQSTDQCNHERMNLEVVHHEAGRSWAESGDWQAGVHVFRLSDGNHVDILVNEEIAHDGPEPIVVFLNGAMSKRAGTTPPYFSGRSVSAALGTTWVAVSDPTLHLDEELVLGWYAANREVQETIASLLGELSRHFGRKLLLAGGSGGGLAALHFASVLGGGTQAFVWNPQTDILDYAPIFVRKYLTHAIPGISVRLPERRHLEKMLAARGITHRVSGLAAAGEVLILQNAADWHLDKHLRPLMAREGWSERDGQFLAPSGGGVARVLAWGDGHAPLPAGIVVQGLTHMVAGHSARETGELVARLVSGCAAPAEQDGPKDPGPRRIAIVGSCVTRDAFEVAEPNHYEISRYLARTALGSMTGPAPRGLDPDYGPLASAFLRRTVRDDIEKGARAWLEGGDFETIVYDMVDERFPVLEYPDGGLVTASWEFGQLGVDTSTATVHEFGSARHTSLWEQGWTDFLALLDRIGARSRLVVHAAPWVATVQGSDQPAGEATEIIEANSWLADRLERIAGDVPPERIIMVDERHWVADPSHQWGVSPFHYVPGYYRDFLARLEKVT
ncbi:DUF6270 domain-containing protein [Luteococcus sediminum]